ncbi:MAG: hypothetical protein WBS33_04815 [Verrucomicrobiia bacterium]
MRLTLLGLSAASVFFFGMGCEKSGPGGPSAAATPTPLSPDTVVRVHWLGRNDLGITAGAYYFMRIWQLPQSGQVEIQSLARLSSAPWRLLQGENAVTNQAGALLYPLLADVVWNESWFEIRQTSDQPAEYLLAIRLDAAHEQLWQTNLAAVAESLTGLHPLPAPDGRFGWSLEKHEAPAHMALTRVGQWTLVSAGPAQNALLAEVTARIQQDHTPYVSQKPDDWLEAYADLPRLTSLLPRSVGAEMTRLGLLTSSPVVSADWNLPRISLAITGDGGHVLTHAELTFSKPLAVGLQPWTVPTNLIHEPLVTFTAARDLKPWLASCKTWDHLQVGPPPDQIFSWALPDGLFESYFAAPLPDADGQVRALAGSLLQKSNPWLAAHGYVGFAPGPDSNGVTWGNSSSIRPFVESVAADGTGGVAYGGLIPEIGAATTTNLFYRHPSFPELLQEMSGRTNLVYYHWELTGARIQSCLYIGEFLCAITRHPPLSLDSASAVWLKTVMPRLGNCTTAITLTGANQLSFDRQSTLGFTAAELNLLAVWLESPQFPYGL